MCHKVTNTGESNGRKDQREMAGDQSTCCVRDDTLQMIHYRRLKFYKRPASLLFNTQII